MKKWLIGCLVTGLILVVVVCGAAYWFVWRPISAAGGDIMGQAEDMAKIGKAEQSVKNKSSYTAPADGKLSAEQVTAFVAIQQIISDKMGPDFALMEEKYKKMNDQETKPEDVDLKEAMGAFADVTKLMAKAKEAQVVGLNAQNMSMEEYHWIRDQVSAALPYLSVEMPAPAPVAGNEPEVSSVPSHESNKAETGDAEAAAVEEAVEKAKEAAEESIKQNMPGGQQIQDMMNGPDSEAVRANVELLRPHKELLLKTMTSAWLAM